MFKGVENMVLKMTGNGFYLQDTLTGNICNLFKAKQVNLFLSIDTF